MEMSAMEFANNIGFCFLELWGLVVIGLFSAFVVYPINYKKAINTKMDQTIASQNEARRESLRYTIVFLCLCAQHHVFSLSSLPDELRLRLHNNDLISAPKEIFPSPYECDAAISRISVKTPSAKSKR
jgi:hypothetical protein